MNGVLWLVVDLIIAGMGMCGVLALGDDRIEQKWRSIYNKEES